MKADSSDSGKVDESTMGAGLGKVTATSRRYIPYLLIGPTLLYLLAFQAFPVLEGARLSLTDTSILRPRQGSFIGVSNYRTLISTEGFWSVLRVTVLYTVTSVVAAIASGLLVALLINRPFKGRGLVRAAITLPWAAPQVAVALIFTWMFNNQAGVFNYLLTLLGAQDSYSRWLDNPDRAFGAVIIITVWMVFPLTALVLLAALQSIPDELYEAARVDGSDPVNVFKNVTLPGIAPTLLVISLFLTIWAFRRFEVIWLLTQGGPQGTTSTIVVDLYRQAFRNTRLGYGAALGIVGVGLSLVVTAGFFAVQRSLARKGVIG